ncbi:MAG: AraC family transcriptional regulator [Nibricoccus sp.]
MASASNVSSQAWLQSPLVTKTGTLELAGLLRNVSGIDPRRMRVLGRFALVLITAGKAYFQDARGNKNDLVAGDVILVFPEIAHAYGPLPGSDWTHVYFVFNGPQFELWRSQELLSPDNPVLRLGMSDYWQQRLWEIVKGDPLPVTNVAIRAIGRFLQVLTEMMASADESSSRGRDAWLQKSLRLLGDRGARGWVSPQQAAASVGLSYENFRKRFVQLTGESPGHYQKRRRLEWACAAIYCDEYSLKQIAEALGFCDSFHFSKAFKQEIGVSPSEYRRRALGG